MHRHRLTLLALVIAAGTVTSSCSLPPPEPSLSPTPTTAPTQPVPTPSTPPEPEPSPTPTVERSRETAKQFIIDYFEAYEEALRTGEPAPAVGFASNNCKKCAAAAAELDKLAVEGSRWPEVTSDAVPYASKESEDASVLHWEIDYSVNQGDKVDRFGGVTASWGAERFIVYITLKHDGRRWWIDGMATGATIGEP